MSEYNGQRALSARASRDANEDPKSGALGALLRCGLTSSRACAQKRGGGGRGDGGAEYAEGGDHADDTKETTARTAGGGGGGGSRSRRRPTREKNTEDAGTAERSAAGRGCTGNNGSSAAWSDGPRDARCDLTTCCTRHQRVHAKRDEPYDGDGACGATAGGSMMRMRRGDGSGAWDATPAQRSCRRRQL